jgi:uncharacterized protein VirK/YbjX
MATTLQVERVHFLCFVFSLFGCNRPMPAARRPAISKFSRPRVLQVNSALRGGPMRIAQTNMASMLWVEALRRRWSLRRAAGESRWQLALHMASWARLFIRQTRWLRSLNTREALRRAAQADPRLYERWHRPYISTHFDLDTRRRIVSSHYAFLMRRFPARLCERIVSSGSARLATLRLDGAAGAYLSLRKPSRGEAGELSLLLLTLDKEVLASCILTFDRCDSVIIGAVRGAGPHTPFEATREFIQGSHGLHPTDLLVSLVRELAALHGLKRIRAVASSARVVGSLHGVGADGDDAFWREQGGMPTESGCHELPLSLVQAPCADGPRSRREKRQLREAFREKACEVFAAAFRTTDGSHPAGAAVSVSRDAAATIRARSHGSQKPASEHGGMLVAGL